MEDFINALKGKVDLPNNSALLTFDDGYIDHYTQVLPVLMNNKLQGSFFIPARILKENSVLDVNKIHFILESCKDIKSLIDDIYKLLNKYRLEFSLDSNEYYYSKLAIPNRFDNSNTIFVKRILQSELQIDLRKIIIDKLFTKYLKISDHIFSNELYLNYNQIKMMVNCGMHIGAHGYNHFWLGKLDEIEQEDEIKKSISFLNEIGIDSNYKTICYPYGSYNDTTLQLMKKYKFDCAFTTVPDTFHIDIKNQYEIPRLDTNDLPIK
jgi:hypothetical protein